MRERKVNKKALEAIDYLLSLAKKERDKDLARFYVEKAVRVGKRTNTRLGERKKLFCKHCFHYLNKKDKREKFPKYVLITCSECGEKKKIFKKEK